ncbi:DUF4882 family protein [Acinetobacter sp. ULE_I010]|uniref:DUF4882 family protein n=1 Tax=Acinetobacter sp. ULE_I010 TaxID=3373065 RepID=UPI003AF5B696
MKKIAIGLLTGLVSMSGWSACTYNFDASLSQVQAALGYNAPNITLFPQNSNQKVGLNLLVGLPSGSAGDYRMNIAMSSQFATQLLANNNNNTSKSLKTDDKILSMLNLNTGTKNQITTKNVTSLPIGDKILPISGNVAIEFSMKVPNQLSNEGVLSTFPVGVTGDLDNGGLFSFSIIYGNSGPGATHGYQFILASSGSPQVNLTGFQVVNASQMQKIGFYFNQTSNQIGLIVNGQNQGYVYTLPSKAKNIGVLNSTIYQNIDSADLNKEFSVEFITDHSKYTQAYPTGTTDMCGTVI